MDRFIELKKVLSQINKRRFKIQYGQIYRESNETDNYGATVFKIQYGQIYRLT